MKRGGRTKVRSFKIRNCSKATGEQEEIAKAYVVLLKACAEQKDLQRGDAVHSDIRTFDFLENNIFIRNTLINMYAKCGALQQARQMLESHPFRDVVSWSALIAGYVQQGNAREALYCYEQMKSENIPVNAVTCMSILRACGDAGAVDIGEKVHDTVVKQRFLKENTLLGGALVGMYCKCGALEKAENVLEGLPFWDMDSWSALISGYAQAGLVLQAVDCLDRMLADGLSPSFANFACILKACGHVKAYEKAYEKGKHLHINIVNRGLLEISRVLGGALVDMYCKFGAIAEALSVLIGLPCRDVISWSAVVAGYMQNGQDKEALECYDRMQGDGLTPNAITFACALKACGTLGALDEGEQIHSEISRQGLLLTDVVLGGALICMYAKCGALAKAHEVIQKLPVRNVVSWTALMTGYAEEGSLEEALNCLEMMQCESVSPNEVTFVCILNACSHAGLFRTGQTWFEKMSNDYGVLPKLEHKACMVDLFCRAGLFEEAKGVIDRMKCVSHLPVWSMLLGACQKWGSIKLARLAFSRALQLNRKDASAYACMCYIYGDISVC